jgi:hypothetical protein
MKRTTEFVLGLIGGIFGATSAVIAMFIGGVDAAFSSTGTSDIIGLGILALILSILGIVGASIVKMKSVLGGIFMLIAAIGGIICISAFYILPGVLLGIAGLMGVIRKDKTKHKNIPTPQ